MEYNPFTSELNHLITFISELNRTKDLLVHELSQFENTDISNLCNQLDDHLSNQNNLETINSHVKKEIIELRDKIKTVGMNVKSRFNPLNWFDDEQFNLRKKLEELNINLCSSNELQESNLKNISQIKETIDNLKISIDKYKQFDKIKICKKLKNLRSEIELSQEKLNFITEYKLKVDNALESILQQIDEIEYNIEVIKDKISEAESFDSDLSYAANSFERALIHKECELVFGHGSPKKIIIQQEKIIRQCQRDLEKAVKRATLIGKNASRVIKKIIIDGNNMCYECGSFIGLKPLLMITSVLQKKYDVIVVFGSVIRPMLKSNDDTIRSQFNTGIKIHIVASKQLADETILNSACNDDNCYILSNDRFGEYTDKEVIRNNRLIKHEIIRGKVMIHDLNINALYD